jgi:hypothetical protein
MDLFAMMGEERKRERENKEKRKDSCGKRETNR